MNGSAIPGGGWRERSVKIYHLLLNKISVASHLKSLQLSEKVDQSRDHGCASVITYGVKSYRVGSLVVL